MHRSQKVSDESHRLPNPICKHTYQELPKIYGSFKKKKTRPSFLFKRSQPYLSSIVSNSVQKSKKKNTISQLALKYQSQPKKNKSKAKFNNHFKKQFFHQEKQAANGKVYKRRKIQKLIPLQENQSSHKVIKAKKSNANISKLSPFLYTINKSQKDKGKQRYQQTEGLVQSNNQEQLNDVHQFRKSRTQNINLNKSREEVFTFIEQPDSIISFSRQIVKAEPKNQFKEFKELKEVEIQVNLYEDLLQERSQKSQQSQNKSSLRQTKTKRNKKNYQKKFSTANVETDSDHEKGKSFQISKIMGESKKGQYSQKVQSILKTKFQQLNELELMSSNKSLSLISNKHFKVPERKQYSSYLKQYKPIDQKSFKMNQLIRKPLFTIIQEDRNGVFFGEVKDNKRQGSGLHVTEKIIFQGDYEEDLPIKGCQKNLQGFYQGYFIKGKRQGYGIFTWNNGQRYEGNWKTGLKSGFGIWKSPQGDYYEGQWKNNKQEGSGTFKHKNSIYRGDFINFMKDGNGEQIFTNGDKYLGQYREGKPDGFGLYTWADNTYYEGNFHEGMRNGYGRWLEQDGTLYEGEFLNDEKHGRGKQTYEDGSCFEVEFRHGQKESI